MNVMSNNDMAEGFDRDVYLRSLDYMVSSLEDMELASNNFADAIQEMGEAVASSSLLPDARESFARICEDAANQMILVHSSTNFASGAAETVADALRGMSLPAKVGCPTDGASDGDRDLDDATPVCELDAHDLATVGYDEADGALDTLEFTMCALAAMETAYSDEVVNGSVNIIENAVVTLREYIGDTREALLMAADGRAKQRKYQRVF